jgi:hypothetical protein
MKEKNSFWKKFSIALAIAAFLLASFAFEGLLNLLSDVPFIGPVARLLQHMRETAY